MDFFEKGADTWKKSPFPVAQGLAGRTSSSHTVLPLSSHLSVWTAFKKDFWQDNLYLCVEMPGI